MTRFIALILAYFFLALAIIGVFLPGLPTVPFLLLTAWFAARGSDRLHRWLYAHPYLGKMLNDWENERAIPRTSKIVAVIMMMISWGFFYYRSSATWLLIGMAILFIIVSSYLITRPEPSNKQ